MFSGYFMVFFANFFTDYCQQTIQQLQTANLVECKSDARLAPLPLGTVMAKYFFSIKTMIAFRGVSTLFMICYHSFCKNYPFLVFWHRINCRDFGQNGSLRGIRGVLFASN